MKQRHHTPEQVIRKLTSPELVLFPRSFMKTGHRSSS